MIIKNDRKYAQVIGAIIINKCLDKGYKINTSKLMKLLYYMQKLHIQKYDEPMFNNEIIALKTGPHIPDIQKFFIYGALGFNEKVEQVITLIDSHEDVANVILDEYGTLTPMEIMQKSLDDNAFKTIWQDGLGKNQIIPIYFLMKEAKRDFEINFFSKRPQQENNLREDKEQYIEENLKRPLPGEEGPTLLKRKIPKK